MWSSRGEERELQQHHAAGRATEAVSLDRQSASTPQRQRFFIDGPARLTSALQIISSAIGANAGGISGASPGPPRTPPPPPSPSHHHPHGAVVLTAVSRSRSEERVTPASLAAAVESEVELVGNEDSLEGAPSSMPYGSSPPSPGPRTIVASDGEVSNGFVKDGQRLPYVFEASDSGNVLFHLPSLVTFEIIFAFWSNQGRERGRQRSCPSAVCAESASSASPR